MTIEVNELDQGIVMIDIHGAEDFPIEIHHPAITKFYSTLTFRGAAFMNAELKWTPKVEPRTAMLE